MIGIVMNSRNECVAFFQTIQEAPSVVWAVRQSISQEVTSGGMEEWPSRSWQVRVLPAKMLLEKKSLLYLKDKETRRA